MRKSGQVATTAARRPASDLVRRLWVPWLFRLLWVVLPVTVGGAVASALDDSGRAAQLTAASALWVGWLVVLVASLVPSTLSLTAVRLSAPVPLALGAAAWVADGPDPLALGVSAAALVVGLSAPLAALFVQGSAYGDETRLLLRTPGLLLLGPVPVAWLAFAAGLTAGPLLLTAGQWAAGVPLTVVGVAVAVLVARSVHQLSRRWLVFVPAGLVVHDPLGLVDSLLVRRQDLRSVGPAPADTQALDLTQRALGLAVEVRLTRALPVTLRVGRAERPQVSDAVLVAPLRPGRALAEATRRRLPVT